MANPGAIEYKHSRTYICVNPDSTKGPNTWRLANNDDIGTGAGGGGGTGGVVYDFDGEDPIIVTTTPGTGTNPTRVVTALDINALDRNTDI